MGRNKIYTTTYYERNREKCLKQAKAYQQAHKEKYRTSATNWRGSVAGRYSKCKRQASVRGLEFALSEIEFANLTSKKCSYCEKDKLPNGIDRIDNNIGYVIDNCQPCCRMCNIMKSNYGHTQFLEHIRKIVQVHAP